MCLCVFYLFVCFLYLDSKEVGFCEKTATFLKIVPTDNLFVSDDLFELRVHFFDDRQICGHILEPIVEKWIVVPRDLLSIEDAHGGQLSVDYHITNGSPIAANELVLTQTSLQIKHQSFASGIDFVHF